MNLVLVGGFLSSLASLCAILAFIYKGTKVITARSKAQQGRIEDLYTLFEIQDEEIKDIKYYLSIPEEERGNFHDRNALKNVKTKMIKHYESHDTGIT